ncbi:MAG: c-type cytochrome [Isosphaeraceae bacterium]
MTRANVLGGLALIGCVAVAAAGSYVLGRRTALAKYHHISGFAWDRQEWARRTKGIRTSYNPDHDLNTETLTLVPGDERWLDFVFWCFANKVIEHQVEAYGGTEWDGPKGGSIFHWAPGSRWETHTLASFGFTIGHVVGEHKWMDTMFPDFFEKYGGVHGINVKDRLAEIDPASPAPWIEFLDYCGGPDSPYYRYLFHREALIDPVRERIYLIGGQGAGFEYTFERFYHEVREVLTDAKAFQFFQLYDTFGPGFACRGGWAKNNLSPQVRGAYSEDRSSQWSVRPGVAKPEKYQPNKQPPPLPEGLPEPEAVKRGQVVYQQQCLVCHGALGDGNGFLAAGLDVKPRDFRQGWYKFRSTKSGQAPSFEDIERTIRVGVRNSSMPAWGQFLTTGQIHDVARYLVTFSEVLTERWQTARKPELLPIPPRPDDLASLTTRGAELYKTAGCNNCHGEKGLGDGPSAATLKDYWDFPIAAADLTYKWQFKNGHTPEHVYRTIFSGLTGTPMPSAESLIPDNRDRWALVSYVLSLSPAERPVLRLKDFRQRFNSAIDSKGIVRR